MLTFPLANSTVVASHYLILLRQDRDLLSRKAELLDHRPIKEAGWD